MGIAAQSAQMSDTDQLPAKAHACFNAGQYDAALKVLSQISSGTADEEDLRYTHNKALAEFASTGFASTQQLSDALTGIREKMKARAAMGGGLGGNAAGDDAAVGIALTQGTAQKQSIPCSESAATAGEGLAELDTDSSVVLYNLAALHFQQMQYGAARAILEHLFLHIEPIDEPLAIHICFLLLDVLCHAARGSLHSDSEKKRFGQQTSAVLSYLERPHALNAAGGTDTSSTSSTPATSDSKTNGSTTAISDDASTVAERSLDQTEFQFRLHLYKAKVLLLLQDHKPCKKEVKSALEIFQRELKDLANSSSATAAATAASGDTTLPAIATQSAFYPVPSAGIQNLSALYLKANLEYLRDNYKKALKLLASCHGFQGSEEYAGPGEPVGPHYYNNMGCLHHKLGCYHASLHYFKKALTAISDGMSTSSTGSLACGAETDGRVVGGIACEVLYNIGLQLLLTDEPTQALKCFEKSALLFYNRPYLWLRMAECSIAIYRQMQSTLDRQGTSAVIRATVGSGHHRRVLLPLTTATQSHAPNSTAPADAHTADGTSSNSNYSSKTLEEQANANTTAAADSSSSVTQAALISTLENASRYLRNVLYLCASAAQTDKAVAETGASVRIPGVSMLGVSLRITAKNLEAKEKGATANVTVDSNGNATSPTTHSSGTATATTAHTSSSNSDSANGAFDGSNEDVCQSALLSLAYVHLGLNDPVAALNYAQKLLAIATVDASRAHTAHVYAAEALCMLDRPTAALEHLTPLSEEHLATAAAATVKVRVYVYMTCAVHQLMQCCARIVACMLYTHDQLLDNRR
jgi:CCR4-NOT transcription complex subunit 10